MIRREHDESRHWNAVDGRGEEINNSNCQLILIDLLTDHTIGFSSALLSFRDYDSSSYVWSVLAASLLTFEVRHENKPFL